MNHPILQPFILASSILLTFAITQDLNCSSLFATIRPPHPLLRHPHHPLQQQPTSSFPNTTKIKPSIVNPFQQTLHGHPLLPSFAFTRAPLGPFIMENLNFLPFFIYSMVNINDKYFFYIYY